MTTLIMSGFERGVVTGSIPSAYIERLDRNALYQKMYAVFLEAHQLVYNVNENWIFEVNKPVSAIFVQIVIYVKIKFK